MQITFQKLLKAQLELTIEVSFEEFKPFIDKAVTKISKEIKIAGFRPGKAPYEIVKKEVGEMAIYEEAAQIAVPKTFVEAIIEEKFETVGEPKIEIKKLAPNNPLVYTATVALFPEITLGHWQEVKVKAKPVEVKDEEVNRTLKELTKMQSKEVLVNREVRDTDKVMVDMEMFLDKIPVDGGQAKDHAVFLDQEHFIPGFKEKLLGAKKGEIKEFQLEFPKEHYQKNLAGKMVDFKVNIKDVYEIITPEINDELAQSLGQKKLDDLKKLLKENMLKEKEMKEKQKNEIELLEKVVKKCTISDIPDILIDAEVHKIIHELEENIARQGMEFNKYLESIKKSREDLMLELVPEGLKRVKSALVSRQLAIQEKIEVNEDELDKEVAKTLEMYKDNQEVHENIKSKWSRDYLRNVLKNRKVIELIRDKCLE